MKNIRKYINEGLKIGSKTKVNTNDNNILDPDDFKNMETPGYDGTGEELIIVGLPFKDKNSEEYIKTKEYIKKCKYTIYNDLEEIDYRDDYDYFVYARYYADNEVNCFTYGYDGAYAEK